jgi:flagellar hook-associated protein 3 FlgL
MRITNTMLVNNMINAMGSNLTRMEKYQRQLATGKKIEFPSDDPIVATRALKLRTDVAEIDQFKRNVKDAQSWMDITENTVGNIGDILQRARELTVHASNGTLTGDDTRKIKEEIDQLQKQVIQLANTTYSGRYIFTGYKTDKALMDSTGDFITDVTMAENIKYQVGVGDDINVNVTGAALFNNSVDIAAGPAPAGTIIDNLKKLSAALNVVPPTNPDTSLIGSLIGKFDVNMETVLSVRADIGARQNRMELTENRLASDNINFTKLMSENEDVDEAETIMNLKNEENVYRASLAGGARIIQPTLVDFLR